MSTKLRQIAINQGEIIDEIYRNFNGITFQMASLESAYRGHTVMKPPTRLFTEIVSIYKTDQTRYQKILDPRVKTSDKISKPKDDRPKRLK